MCTAMNSQQQTTTGNDVTAQQENKDADGAYSQSPSTEKMSNSDKGKREKVNELIEQQVVDYQKEEIDVRRGGLTERQCKIMTSSDIAADGLRSRSCYLNVQCH